MARPLSSSLEPLESRIAPAALTVLHPLADAVAGVGKTSVNLDLGNMFDPSADAGFRTHVEFITNFDTDPNTPGLQPGKIDLELFNDKAPLSVQNFINYVNGAISHSNYDGVFFHRSVDQSGLQILQAGGFDFTNLASHIAVGPEVHNEFDANDTERQNVDGTIAMAKTGLSPNTGTSEFFFNLGDNSQTLGGSNNGGYTVFGKVTAGLDILHTILARPTADVSSATHNGALGTVPVQTSYNADPDNSPSTPSPKPTASQLYEITSAKILPPTNGVSEGVTFSVSVTDHTTHLATNLLSPKLVGDNLSLNFKQGASGIADVTVHATKTGFDPVDETFSVTIQPNLIINSAGDTLQPITGPGDTGLAKIKLSNNGAAALTGKYDITVYMSRADANDSSGLTLDGSDVVIGTMAGKALNLASGQSLVLPVNVTLPATLENPANHTLATDGNGNPTQLAGGYHLIAVATPSAGATSNERYTDDNVMVDATTTHQAANIFGALKSGTSLLRNDSSFTYPDGTGHNVTATLTGPGYGELLSDGHGGWDLQITNSTAATAVTFTSIGGHTSLDRVYIPQTNGSGTPIGSLNLASVDLSGWIDATGGAKTITLGDIQADGTDHYLVLGNSAALAYVNPIVKVGSVADTTFESAQVVKSLAANAWTDTGTRNEIMASGILSLTVTGDLESDVVVNANVVGADPSLTPTVQTFKVGGVLDGSTVKIGGNVGTVDLGAIASSKFLVGADSVPDTVAGFNSVRSIASFIVRGIADKYDISDSVIAAAKIGSIQINGVADHTIDATSGTQTFGFVADTIGSYARQVPQAQSASGITKFTNLTTGTVDVVPSGGEIDNYEVRLV